MTQPFPDPIMTPCPDSFASFSVSFSRDRLKRLLHFLFVCPLLALGCLPAHALVAGSFNIRYDNPMDVENGNGWTQRAPVIGSLIRFHRFDILGIQEAYRQQVDDLQKLLPTYGHSGCGRDDGKDAGEFIFFDLIGEPAP